MRVRYIVRLLPILALLLALLPSPSVWADNSTKFQLDAIEDGDKLQVKVTANGAADVYAYDLLLNFDPAHWTFTEAKSSLPGFSVQPIIKDNSVRIAHTQVGKVAGKSGDVLLATLSFVRKGNGDNAIRLAEAKMVDSKLASVTYTPDVSIEASGQIWPDIRGHWAEATIRAAAEKGLVDGYEDNTFRPDNSVTRAEFAAMLTRALKLSAEASPQAELPFADANAIAPWAKPYISAAVTAKLVDGYEDGTFRADRLVTRMEMTAMIVRSLGDEAISAEAAVSAFADADLIPSWGKDAAETARAIGLIQGRTGNLFAPEDSATRAEAVTILMNLLSAAER